MVSLPIMVILQNIQRAVTTNRSRVLPNEATHSPTHPDTLAAHLDLRGRAWAVLHVDLDLLAALASLVGHLDGVLAGLVPRGLLDGVGDLLVLNIDLDFLYGDGLASPQQLGVDLGDPCAGHWEEEEEEEVGVRLRGEV